MSDRPIRMAMAHGGTLEWLTAQSIIDTLARDADGEVAIGFMQEQGLVVGALRERLAHRFLDSTKAEWLVFVDSDMVWKLEDVYDLVHVTDPETAPVVSAIMFVNTPTGIHAAGAALTESGEEGVEIEWEGEGLVKVAMVGTGFTSYHRSALETVRDRHGSMFAEAWEGDRFYGTDVAFSIRARERDIPLHVTRDIHVGHVKRVVLDEGWARASREMRSVDSGRTVS